MVLKQHVLFYNKGLLPSYSFSKRNNMVSLNNLVYCSGPKKRYEIYLQAGYLF